MCVCGGGGGGVVSGKEPQNLAGGGAGKEGMKKEGELERGDGTCSALGH